MSRQTLNRGTTANDGTGDTLRTGAQKINENFEELYGLFGGDTVPAPVYFDSNGVVFEGISINDYETTVCAVDPTQDNIIYVPNDGGTLILDSCQQTLSNKTILSPILTTPKIKDTDSSHTYNLVVSNLSANRNITLPLLTSGDTFVFNNHTATLTNKTLVTPLFNNPKIGGVSGGGQLFDSAGNEYLHFTSTASAVNHVSIGNASTGNTPQILSKGDDTNISLRISTQGSGLILIDGGFALESETVSASTACSVLKTTTLFDAGGAITPTLADGTVVGQLKFFSNKNAGVATLTPSNFGAGTSIALDQNETATLIWDGVNWQIQSTYGGTVA